MYKFLVSPHNFGFRLLGERITETKNLPRDPLPDPGSGETLRFCTWGGFDQQCIPLLNAGAIEDQQLWCEWLTAVRPQGSVRKPVFKGSAFCPCSAGACWYLCANQGVRAWLQFFCFVLTELDPSCCHDGVNFFASVGLLGHSKEIHSRIAYSLRIARWFLGFFKHQKCCYHNAKSFFWATAYLVFYYTSNHRQHLRSTPHRTRYDQILLCMLLPHQDRDSRYHFGEGFISFLAALLDLIWKNDLHADKG